MESNKTRFLARTVGALTVSVYILFAVTAALHTHNRIGIAGSPLFYDFSVFYQSGSFADQGHAADAYDDAKMMAASNAAFPGNTLRLPWNYPPTFQLLLMPFAAVPYFVGWLLWSAILYGLYALLAGHLITDKNRLWILLLAPGAAVNLFFGQNGLLTTVLLGGGVLLLQRRPIIGGILLGMMAYKPQFAALVPLVLMAGREWRAFTAAVASQVVMVLVTIGLFGTAPWFAFLHKLVEPAAIFSSSSSNWRGIPSVTILARTLGLDATASSICHWTIAAMAAGIAIWAWRRTGDALLRIGVLAAATVLVTPYLRGYDLVLLVLPIAALIALANINLFEKSVATAAWLLPAILMFAAPGFQFGPLVSIAMMAVVARRIVQVATESSDKIAPHAV